VTYDEAMTTYLRNGSVGKVVFLGDDWAYIAMKEETPWKKNPCTTCPDRNCDTHDPCVHCGSAPKGKYTDFGQSQEDIDGENWVEERMRQDAIDQASADADYYAARETKE